MKRFCSVLSISLGMYLALQAKAQDVKLSNDQCHRIQFAPVMVSPTMQWAVPNSKLNGAPANLTGGLTIPLCSETPGLLAVMVGVGGHGSLYDFDWVSYYKSANFWAVPNSNLNGPPASLSSGMMMMPN
jgi:hypothetical protein